MHRRQRLKSHLHRLLNAFFAVHILLAPSVWNKGIVPPNIFFAAGATDENDWKDVTNKFLASGDAALSNNQVKESIEIYLQGIELLPSIWSGEESNPQSDGDVDGDDNDDETELPDGKVIEAIISLHTNYATALSYLEGSTENVVAAYRKACWCYQNYVRQRQQQSDDNDVEKIPKEIASVAASSYFYLGMTYQDLASSAATPTESGTMDSGKQMQYLENSARAYAKATKIDPNHWSSYANMGVVLADVGTDGSGNKAISLELYEEGIMSYQMAIDILAGAANNGGGNDAGPTDPPGNKNEVIAELQYRIGLCLVPFLFTQQMESDGSSVEDYNTRKCTLHSTPNAQEPNSPAITRSCLELAAYSFSNALQSYRYHDGANNALNLVTADATFGMSTDVTFVQNLFEEYASSFEHSLVDELRYNGFHRMRILFDHAMLQEGTKNKYDKKMFPLVVDAGCGTGLAGEVFRNISQSLVGVDLSHTIIDHAKLSRPDLYDQFQIGDITEILRQYGQPNQHAQPIALIVAADTFIYFNDLNELFASMAAGLGEGGYAVFSLENVSKNNEKHLRQLKPLWRWQITPSGRIAHRKEYVEEIAEAHSFDVVLYEKLDNFREEKGAGVRGHFFVLKKRLGGGAMDQEL